MSVLDLLVLVALGNTTATSTPVSIVRSSKAGVLIVAISRLHAGAHRTAS